jgi:hypothetical protein
VVMQFYKQEKHVIMEIRLDAYLIVLQILDILVSKPLEPWERPRIVVPNVGMELKQV